MISDIIDKLNFELSNDIKIAIEAVIKAGNEIVQIYDNEEDFGVEIKGDDSPVTKADLLSDKIILDVLKKNSEYPILSEETQGDYSYRKYSKKIWVVDPIDGTQDFINKTGEYSVMIGLLEDNHPTIGVVYAPSLDKLYFAEKGFGAYLYHDGAIDRLTVSSQDKLEDMRLVTSRNNFKPHEEECAKKLHQHHFVKMGSAGIKFAEIGLGNAEFCFYLTNKLGEWDVVASMAILNEAGGECYDKFGNELEFNKENPTMDKGVIGTNGKCFDKIIAVTKLH